MNLRQSISDFRKKGKELGELVIDFGLKHPSGFFVTVLMPASFAYGQMTRSNRALKRLKARTQGHDERVRKVQEQVRRAASSGRPMATARPTWKTMSIRTQNHKQGCERISVDLGAILGIDEQKRVIRVEPLATMAEISEYLTPRGYSLANTVEMDDLTIGGLALGFGISPSSHRMGLMQESIASFEIVLGDGSLVRASATENTDLFYALPWSIGTLGFVVGLEVKIVPIRPYIEVKYIPCKSQEEICAVTEEMMSSDDAPDYVEGILYSKSAGVIICGNSCDLPKDHSVNRINDWYKPWFYKHAQEALSRGEFTEYVPFRHFLHRHTRSIFWELENFVPYGNHPLFRWTLGWMGAPKVSIMKLAMSPNQIRKASIEKRVTQEAIVPLREMSRAIDLFHEVFEVYPLLVYPARIYDHGQYQGFVRKPLHPLPGKNYEIYFDLGAYGVPNAVKRGLPWNYRKSIKALEAFTQEVGGILPYYMDLLMSRDEFEQMMDHTLYRAVRKKYRALGAFPEVYDKIKRTI